jgi:hypothetical protein
VRNTTAQFQKQLQPIPNLEGGEMQIQAPSTNTDIETERDRQRDRVHHLCAKHCANLKKLATRNYVSSRIHQ